MPSFHRNSLTGVTPIKKFTDRKKTVARIRKELQKLAGPETDVAATDAPAAEPKPARKAKTPKPAKATKPAREAKTVVIANTGVLSRIIGRRFSCPLHFSTALSLRGRQ